MRGNPAIANPGFVREERWLLFDEGICPRLRNERDGARHDSRTTFEALLGHLLRSYRASAEEAAVNW